MSRLTAPSAITFVGSRGLMAILMAESLAQPTCEPLIWIKRAGQALRMLTEHPRHST